VPNTAADAACKRVLPVSGNGYGDLGLPASVSVEIRAASLKSWRSINQLASLIPDDISAQQRRFFA
jgi:hypothetical protein